MLPPSPPGSRGPFTLSEHQLLEKTLEEIGFKIINNDDVNAIWEYPNIETALKGQLSAGPVAKAIETSSFVKVYDAVAADLKAYIQPNGTVVFKNKLRVVICEK